MYLCDDMVISKNRAIAKSYAKINLTLDVLGRLDNGYHEIKMIMQSLNLFDLVIVDKQPHGINISSNLKFLPRGNGNIAYKAAEIFFSETGISGGAKILIHKNIPVAAGLAGGSGNGAAVLCALNLLYNANLPESRLCEMGLKLGADVPYCITGGTQLAEGIGEKLTPLASVPCMPIVLVKPPVNIMTASIYNKIDTAQNLQHPDTDSALLAIEKGDMPLLFSSISNIMETVTIDSCCEISRIKQQMLDFGAHAASMSGSGPTVFGIFPDNKSAKAACDFFSENYDDVYLTHTID